MKILVLSGASYISGAERVTLDIIKDLSTRGHNVHCIVSGWTDGRFIAHLEEAGISYTKVKLGWIYRSKPRWTLDTLLHFPQAYLQCRKTIRQFQPDVLYVHSYRPVFQLFFLINTPVIYHAHDTHSASTQGKVLLQWADRKISRYIACADFVKNDLIKVGIQPEKICTIHNGVDTKVSMVRFEDQHPEVLRVGIVGQIIPKKGHEDLLKAFVQCRAEGLPIRLIIVGNGDQEFTDLLKSTIAHAGLHDAVEWRGFVDDPEQIYEGVDILVAPTRTAEPFGLIVPEANVRGIPVIATNQGGFLETVRPGYNGFLVDPESPEQIARSIHTLYYNRSLLKTLGMNGRELVLGHFNRQSMLDQVFQIFNDYER